MGADMSMALRLTGGEWVDVPNGRPGPASRHYGVFSVLSGVRAGRMCVAEGGLLGDRGIPPDAPVDDYAWAPSHATVKELRAVNWADPGVPVNDKHGCPSESAFVRWLETINDENATVAWWFTDL